MQSFHSFWLPPYQVKGQNRPPWRRHWQQKLQQDPPGKRGALWRLFADFEGRHTKLVKVCCKLMLFCLRPHLHAFAALQALMVCQRLCRYSMCIFQLVHLGSRQLGLEATEMAAGESMWSLVGKAKCKKTQYVDLPFRTYFTLSSLPGLHIGSMCIRHDNHRLFLHNSNSQKWDTGQKRIFYFLSSWNWI